MSLRLFSWPGFHCSVIAVCTLVASVVNANALPITLVPEKVPPVVADREDSQNADRVHFTGWIGSRIAVNEGNRLVKLDPTRLLEGYRKRPGRQTWDGEHVGKWMHAATLAWANTGDPALREKLDYVARELVKCQLPDGYLGTYSEDKRWTEWDVWAHKYDLIGLITYMRYTGNMEPLPACRRMADLLCNTFGDEPGKRDILQAGPHMGMAPTSVLEPMVLLHRLTGEPRYLDFCKYILRAWEEPKGPKIISTLLNEKRVDHIGDGKAYEMLSCINGAVEYYRTTGDEKILQAALNAWQDIVDKRLYITGTASYREFFHDDYDLPNVNNVGETCVTVTWLQFNAHLLRLTGEARFAEQMEKTILNQLFGAQCPDGSAWGYYVQMQGKKPYSSTLDGHCCLSSGPRGVALIPTFAVMTDDKGIAVNLYDAGTADLKLRDGTPVSIVTKTRYPENSDIHLTVSPETKASFIVKLRIPAWCHNAQIKVDGEKVQPQIGSDGYVAIQREWKKGDKIDLRFPLEPRVVLGTHHNENRLAVCYGPLVLAADEAFLDSKSAKLPDIGARNTYLASFHFKAQSAPAKWKSWSGAQIFKIDAIDRDSADLSSFAKALRIGLVPYADAGAAGTSYKIWLPYKAPRADRNLLSEGIEIRSRKPNQGSIVDDNFETIASTFNNKRAQDDWFGVQVDEPVSVKQIVFAHGKTFHDGGWFDSSAEKPYVQIKSKPDGAWETVAKLTDYPATTAKNAAGLKGGERFICNLPKAIDVYGVRVVGKPATGDNPKQAFSTCAELHAFASNIER